MNDIKINIIFAPQNSFCDDGKYKHIRFQFHNVLQLLPYAAVLTHLVFFQIKSF